MKRRIIEIILAFIIGAFTCCVFFSIIGMVVAYIELPLLKLVKWYCLWPKDYRIYSALVDSIVFQLFSQIPLTAFSGTALGLIITKGPKQHGFIAALGAISFYTYLHLEFILRLNRLTKGDFGSIQQMLSSFTIFDIQYVVLWVVLFIPFTSIGYRLKTPRGYFRGPYK
jgi:hypothetical protein